MKQVLYVSPETFVKMISGLVASGVTFVATEKDGQIEIEFTGGIIMGALNFGRLATDNIYAIWMGRDVEVLDEEGMPTGETDYEYPESWEMEEDLIWFKEVFNDTFKAKLNKRITSDWTGDKDELFSLSSYKSYSGGDSDIDVEVRLEGVIEIGYHEGAAFNFSYAVYLDGYRHSDSWDSVEDINIDLGYSNHSLSRVKEAQVEKWANKWAKAELEYLAKQANKFFAHVCGHKLIKVAQFSNGEAIYQEVK